MTEEPEPPVSRPTVGGAGPAHDSETVERRPSRLQSQYAAAIERIRSLERQLHATEQLLEQALENVQLSKRKLARAGHYKSLVHRLRKRWYLRPFVPASELEPQAEDSLPSPVSAHSAPALARCWQLRGPRFDPHNRQERQRIAIVGHQLSERLFGAENSLIDLITAIDPQRFDIFATFPQRNDRVFAIIEEHVQGICVFPYAWWHKDRPFQEHTVSLFEQLYREQGIDLVHANTITLSDPLIAAQRVGIPAISHARELISLDEDLASQLGATPTEIATIVCRNASYVLANSVATLANYPCRERSGYLYNSVDPSAFDFPNRVDPAAINVGLISSNLPKKGIFDFVELARQAEKRLQRVKFQLIGPVTETIEQLRVAPPSLPRNLSVRGYILQPPAAYRDLNIVLNLSHFAESFGRTVAEAMTARRPVIAYRRGALPELVTDGMTGFLVPFRDLAAVLNRLSFFVHNPAQIAAFGERARKEAVQRFSPELFSVKLNALYGRLIAEARPAAAG